jgi:hypothetical protein
MRRLPALIGTAWGVGLLLAPDRILRVAGVRNASGGELVTTRVLGARHVAEGVVLLTFGSRARIPVVVIESAHALSMVALAIAAPRFRRESLVSACVAVPLAVMTGIGEQARA